MYGEGQRARMGGDSHESGDGEGGKRETGGNGEEMGSIENAYSNRDMIIQLLGGAEAGQLPRGRGEGTTCEDLSDSNLCSFCRMDSMDADIGVKVEAYRQKDLIIECAGFVLVCNMYLIHARPFLCLPVCNI